MELLSFCFMFCKLFNSFKLSVDLNRKLCYNYKTYLEDFYFMKQEFNITKIGKKELEAELELLISQRKEISEEVATARDFGDLRENSEYDAARKKQALAESRIMEIENILQNAVIIGGGEKGVVSLGNQVSLKNLENGKEVKYTMVGAVEANPLEGKISNESPIGQQIMGKKLGEEVDITTPKGVIKYEITEIN